MGVGICVCCWCSYFFLVRVLQSDVLSTVTCQMPVYITHPTTTRPRLPSSSLLPYQLLLDGEARRSNTGLLVAPASKVMLPDARELRT
jgi:hypothetical protein